MTELDAYLDVILAKYAGSFDIQKDYLFENRTYPAYGSFSSLGEKYVLIKKAKLWSVKAFEYIFFTDADTCTKELLDDIRRIMTDYMEPVLVRKNEKYPEKDHMYSYLTFAVLCRQKPSEDVIREIRKFSFDRGYLFSFRGHAEGHLVVADMETESVFTNAAGRELNKLYKKTFDDVRRGARGYKELYA
ncbi:MAG: hypothetical protein J6I56_02885 [Lachnospiraceae bacterium]|nr:hypothetical protein [Lachnospiraceae bacterium]